MDGVGFAGVHRALHPLRAQMQITQLAVLGDIYLRKGLLADHAGIVAARHCAENSVASRTAWGPFCERESSKMRPHGGRRLRDFKERRLSRVFASSPARSAMPRC